MITNNDNEHTDNNNHTHNDTNNGSNACSLRR